MQYWHAQTFTALSDHQVDSVKLLAYRIGYPGTLIVSLRATDYSGHPMVMTWPAGPPAAILCLFPSPGNGVRSHSTSL
jgi:hypothetical protein